MKAVRFLPALVFLGACGRVGFDSAGRADSAAFDVPLGVDARSPCVAEDFSAPLDAMTWGSFETAPASSAVAGGELVIHLATTTQVAYAGIETVFGDYQGSRVEVELVEAPAIADGTEATAGWAADVNNSCLIYVGNTGKLSFLQIRMGSTVDVASIPFDPVGHRHWAIQHDTTARTVAFSTSPDGSTWTVQHQAPLLIPISNVRLELLAGTYLSVASPGRARFDNVLVFGCSL